MKKPLRLRLPRGAKARRPGSDIPSETVDKPSEQTPLAEAAQALFDLMMAQKLCFVGVAAEYGFSPMQAVTLFNLNPEVPVAMSTFARKIHCEPANITGVIDKLEARGLVKRQPAKEDRRIKLIQVTAAGARLRAALAGALARPPEWMAVLPSEHIAQLRDILTGALAHERSRDT